MNRELLLSTLADNGGFALEYCLQKEPNKDNLLKNGIEYCELIIDASEEMKPDIFKDEEKYERIDTIRMYYTRRNLVNYLKMAFMVKNVLMDILDKKDIKITEKDIRSYQHFFNETSRIFLAAEMRKMRVRQESRRW